MNKSVCDPHWNEFNLITGIDLNTLYLVKFLIQLDTINLFINGNPFKKIYI